MFHLIYNNSNFNIIIYYSTHIFIYIYINIYGKLVLIYKVSGAGMKNINLYPQSCLIHEKNSLLTSSTFSM